MKASGQKEKAKRLTITNLRTFNKLGGVAVALLAVFVSSFAGENSEVMHLFSFWGPVGAALVFLLAYLGEPYWVHRLHRRNGRPDKLPFELNFLPHRFGLELGEILYFETALEEPAFSSGHPLSPRRIYLRKGMEERFNQQQLQGLFAAQLAELSQERDTKLWASGAAAFVLLVFTPLIVLHLLPGVIASFQLMLALIPLLIALLDVIIIYLSRHLVYLSDRHAARVLIYPDCLLSYLQAHALLAKEEEQKVAPSTDKKKKRPGLMKRISAASPYPSPRERLAKLGALYPEAEQLHRKLQEKAVEKKPPKKPGVRLTR